MRRLSLIGLLLLLACLAVSAAAETPDPIANGLIVYLQPGTPCPAGGTPLYGLPTACAVPAATGKRLADQLDEWAKQPGVVWAEPNYIVRVEPRPEAFNEGIQPYAVNDPLASQQYSLNQMSVPTAWATSRGDGVLIAVIDTGVDFSHPDLAGKIAGRGHDFINNDDDATDDHGHGTHVSGIAAGATNNNQGIAGVGFNARVLPVKVLGSNGSGDNVAVANGIRWATDQGVRVINMSLGSTAPTAAVQSAVDYAWSRGVVVVCAAGNAGSAAPQYPAAYPNCISVSATDAADRLASFSSFGDTVDVAAPGVQILSTVRGGRYESWSGTSMATPNVAGVVALLWAAHPAWSNAQIRAALENNADNIGQATYFGHGRVNAARALGSAPGPTLTPAPTPNFPTPTPAPNLDGQIVQAINRQRATYGKPALVIDPALTTIARQHNQFMDEANCFAHDCPGEPTVWQRLASAGYGGYAGSEVIARGYDTPDNLVVNGWMMSTAHRDIILGPYNRVGCAWDEFDGGYMGRFQTCDLGNRQGEAVPTPTRTPVPNHAQPGGWYMLIEIPYDTSTQQQIDELYWGLCNARKLDGVACAWHRYRTLDER